MTLPYATWKVSEDKELKLRLTSLQATKVEEKSEQTYSRYSCPLKVKPLLCHH